MRRKVLLTAAGLCTVFLSAISHGADYPARPVRFVIGFAPGGASDTMVRVIEARLSENLRQPVVIDNRPEAGSPARASIDSTERQAWQATN
jgi:tripartite-type tricarboxylate transporter receptor subunit TctC